MSSTKEKSQQVNKVDIKEYRYFGKEDTEVHEELTRLVNDINATKFKRNHKINGNRCTVIISTPKAIGGSFGSHPGHCGIALWNSETLDYQSFGILCDGTFADEEVNARNDILKRDENFKIWYFTISIDAATYESLRKRMSELGTKEVVYGKFLVARGWKEDASYSCVTAVDTILVAGRLSKAVASMASTPYAYAQTFTRAAWYVSYADNMKHM